MVVIEKQEFTGIYLPPKLDTRGNQRKLAKSQGITRKALLKLRKRAKVKLLKGKQDGIIR